MFKDMSKVRTRLFFLLFVLIIFLFTEYSLRLAGIVYKNYRAKKQLIHKSDKNEIRILCLGDSFTFGVGAPKGFSYPEQLQNLCNQGAGSKCAVYNLGVPGTNSSKLYKQLEGFITTYQPNIAIVMTGINNNSNFDESNYFLFLENNFLSNLYRLDANLSGLRTYKLVKMLISYFSINNDLTKKPIYASNSNNQKEQDDFVDTAMNIRVSQEAINEAKAHFLLAREYEVENKFKLAINELNYSLKLNPRDSMSYAELGFIHIHRIVNLDLAIDLLKKSLSLNPENINARESLMTAYHRRGDLDLALKQARKLHQMEPRNMLYETLARYRFPGYKDLKIFESLLGYDLKNIYELLKSKNVALILQTYPGGWPNPKLRDFASRYHIPLVDNEAAFNKIKDISKYLAEDGHCNDMGYFVIAVNIYNLLCSSESNFFNKI